MCDPAEEKEEVRAYCHPGSSSTPPAFEVAKIKCSGGKLTVTGKAKSAKAVVGYRNDDKRVGSDRQEKDKRISLFGPASKAMVLYMMGMVPLGMG